MKDLCATFQEHLEKHVAQLLEDRPDFKNQFELQEKTTGGKDVFGAEIKIAPCLIVLSPLTDRVGGDKSNTSKIFTPQLLAEIKAGKTQVEICLDDATYYKHLFVKGTGNLGWNKGESKAIRELLDASGAINKEEALMAIMANAIISVQQGEELRLVFSGHSNSSAELLCNKGMTLHVKEILEVCPKETRLVIYLDCCHASSHILALQELADKNQLKV